MKTTIVASVALSLIVFVLKRIAKDEPGDYPLPPCKINFASR